MAGCLGMLLGLAACEVDSFMDPSVVGRWERTPVVLPILDRLDVIDEPTSRVEGLSSVQPQDLIPHVYEYVIGSGDVITITVFELMQPNLESVLARQVDELGMIRLPVIGPVKVQGMTPSGLEEEIVEILDAQGVLKDATVSVVVQQRQHNTFSVIGEPRLSGTAIGAYMIPKSDFRLLDAMAMARGASGSIKKLFVIRQVSLMHATQYPIGISGETQPLPDVDQGPRDPVDLIEDLLDSVDDDFRAGQDAPAPQGTQLPEALDRSLDSVVDQPSHWAYVNGQWVRVDQNQGPTPKAGDAAMAAGSQPMGRAAVTQRVIEVPYDKLLDGDMRYNMVIRPGDVIRVPPPVIGNVYIGGAISRPGTYALPGDKDLTFKQLIFAAGNLSSVAIPERVDLIRRVGDDQEATVRLNLRAMFDGTQPDFYLKPNDTINIGTSFAAVPLAVLRNGLRVSYGFGFVLDRNFSTDVFGPIDTDNN